MKLAVSRLDDGIVSIRYADMWIDHVKILPDVDREKAPSVFRAEAARRIINGENIASVARSFWGSSDNRARNSHADGGGQYMYRGNCRNATDA